MKNTYVRSSFFLFFFGLKTQPNHWTKRMVNCGLMTTKDRMRLYSLDQSDSKQHNTLR